MAGTLYLVATPIGNLEDMTFRAIRTLKEVDLIAAEDTRNSIKLLNHFEIQTPMTSYHEYNKFDKGRKLVEKLEEGLDIAVITDAGTPGISDPGEELVKMCYETGIRVTSVPGPAACVTALTMSGLPTRRFTFEAFLPTDKKEREEVLKEMAAETRTIVMYEAPHRLVKTLKLLSERLGDRKVTVCRELTKRYETAFQSTLEESVAYYEANAPKGECVIVIAGRSREEIRQEEKERWEDMSIEDHMEYYISQGVDRKEAMKQAAKDEIMERFGRNEIQILVSTTVIEVGIDVPNATVMMIENAERFGLAQLHQLRGRVGRGKYQSYCIFMTGSKAKETKKRLEILNKTNDGFKIASEDLKLRGPGDLFGIRQSGLMDFGLGDIYQDAAILQKANEAAEWLLKNNPEYVQQIPDYEGTSSVII